MAHFTDWFPTLVSMAGVEAPADLVLDGVDIMPVLRGESGGIYPQRFWQWNRYVPIDSCNAAMRDGDWKLLRPIIKEAMEVSPVDTAHDHAVKYFPEHYDDVVREPKPSPDRSVAAACPALQHC